MRTKKTVYSSNWLKISCEIEIEFSRCGPVNVFIMSALAECGQGQCSRNKLAFLNDAIITWSTGWQHLGGVYRAERGVSLSCRRTHGRRREVPAVPSEYLCVFFTTGRSSKPWWLACCRLPPPPPPLYAEANLCRNFSAVIFGNIPTRQFLCTTIINFIEALNSNKIFTDR